MSIKKQRRGEVQKNVKAITLYQAATDFKKPLGAISSYDDVKNEE